MPRPQKTMGRVFKIQRHALHDGPGIRTLVFLKGCPLRCLWCFNPESHSTRPQAMHEPAKCLGCGACLEACPLPGAVEMNKSGVLLHHEICNGCGLCAQACPSGAMSVTGGSMSVDQVLSEVLKDRVFYERSGGGVTLSGGEVAMQPDFAGALLQSCRRQGIHTAVETSGYSPWPDLKKIIDFSDLVFFDLKAMDPLKHLELTGVDNGLVLENARSIARSGTPMIIRMPLIPGCNDSEQNIKATGAFVAGQLPGVSELHVLPYEMLGEAKYHKLGRDYALKNLMPPADEATRSVKEMLGSYGLRVQIKG